MKVKIFRPAKSAMQSGKQRVKKWLMKPIEENNARSINQITGWISSDNTISQLSFEFASKEAAIQFAENRGFEYEIHDPKISSIKPKSYAANFNN